MRILVEFGEMLRWSWANHQRKPSSVGLFLVVLLISTLVPARPAFGQSGPPVYTFAECENTEEDLLLSELNQIVRSVFDLERGNLDYQAIVDRNWVELGMDQVVDSAVDKAAETLLEQEGLWDRIKSGWHPPTAKSFATKIIATAFESTEFGDAVNDLSVGIVDELAVELQIMTTISASSALLCLQEFIDERFSHTMSVTLERVVQNRVGETRGDFEVPDEVGEVLASRAHSLTGISVILGTQIAKALAKKVSARIVGKIVTRIIGKAAGALIPIAGWIIGGALIIWDITQLHKGSIPQIRESLKEEDVKKLIRTQIAEVVKGEIEEELENAVDEVTVDMYQHWKSFLEGFLHVLRLAEQNPRFREILDGVTADQVDKLSKLVEIGEKVLGREWLNQIIESGDFERIRALPEDSFEILRERANPDLVLEWDELAGELIIGVVDTKLYLHAFPSDFDDRDSFENVLALKDTIVIERLMGLKKAERRSLLRLPTIQTQWALTKLAVDEASWLASFLEGLSVPSQRDMMDFVMRVPTVTSKLQSSDELQGQFLLVLALSAESPTFRTILGATSAEDLDKLTSLSSTAIAVLKPGQLKNMISSGQFETILALPQATFVILRATGDPALLVSWADLAGEAILRVAETGLYGVFQPEDFRGREELEQVLDLEHPLAIQTLMSLDKEERKGLLQLPPEEAREILLSDLSEPELKWLTIYLEGLGPPTQQLLAQLAVEKKGLVQRLLSSEELAGKFVRVLETASTVSLFKDIVESTNVNGLEKLTELLVLAEEELSPEKMVKMIESGQFESILDLPKAAFEILRGKAEPALVIGWAELAGDSFVQVVKTKIFDVASPEMFRDKVELDAVLALDDTKAFEVVIQLERSEREVVLGLAPGAAKQMLVSLEMEQITWLIPNYLAHLPKVEGELLASRVAGRPGLLQELDNETVRDALLRDGRIERLLVFIDKRVEKPVAIWPTIAMLTAAVPLVNGDIPLALYSHYFLTPSLVLLAVLLVALALAGVWAFRRPKYLEN